MSDSVWGQVWIQPDPPSAGSGLRVGSTWVNTSCAPTVGRATCVGVDPVVFTPTTWEGAGVPEAWLGADGDRYLRSDGTLGTIMYARIAGAWAALA